MKMFGLITLIYLGYFGVFADVCSQGQPDGTGIEILGTRYDCKYLQSYYEEDRYIGIYDNRRSYCEMPHTDCCATCSKILSCTDAPYNGIYLAESYFSCSYLLEYHPEDRMVGIYKNRRFVCEQATTDCCESCQKVLAESVSASTPSPTQATTISVLGSDPTPTRPQTAEKYEDTCVNNCLWIADGKTGKCSWLLDPSNTAYKIRRQLCSTAPGCKGTCQKILQDTENVAGGVQYAGKTDTPVCTDTYVMIGKNSYGCMDLLNPVSNIYNNRDAICTTDENACCLTCRDIEKEKPSVVIKYSDQNMIDKNSDVIAVVPATENSDDSINSDISKTTNKVSKPRTSALAQTPKANGLLAVFRELKAQADRLQKEREARNNAFKLIFSNMFAMFNKMKFSGK